jgi:glycosyltransferase involved in cell wall biosynthesis
MTAHPTNAKTRPTTGKGCKLLFFITEDWFFCSHFLDRAIAARQAGFEVTVVTRVGKNAALILGAGIRLIPIRLNRSGTNLFQEIGTFLQLFGIYRRERPDIVHHIAVKPIIYGTLAARLSGVGRVVNAPVGLGYVFSSSSRRARLMRPLVLAAYRWFMNPPGSVAIFENPDDLNFLSSLGIVASGRTRLIRGAGVDVGRFQPSEEAEGPVVVALAARMLWEKGVREFVEAAAGLKSAGVAARFVLIGAPDERNPASVPIDQLDAWQREGTIEYWGFRENMAEVMRQVHIVCLPTSYGEGLPKVLVEAAATGRPIVATDVPGCREIVHPEVNGLLVPARAAAPLCEALRKLIESPELRRRMGQAGREMAAAGFSTRQVCDETIAVYRELSRQGSSDLPESTDPTLTEKSR